MLGAVEGIAGELDDVERVHHLDRDTWSTVARQTAAAFAAWSNAVEETPGDLAAASDALAKSAQTCRRPVKPQRAGRVAMSGARMLLAIVARGGQGAAAQLAMLRQLMNLYQAATTPRRPVGRPGRQRTSRPPCGSA